MYDSHNLFNFSIDQMFFELVFPRIFFSFKKNGFIEKTYGKSKHLLILIQHSNDSLDSFININIGDTVVYGLIFG